MVRISLSVLALAATAMSAAVHVRSTGTDVAPRGFSARAASGMHFVKRQAAGNSTADADAKFNAFLDTLTPDQKAKGDAVDKKQQESEALLNDDQKKKLDEVDQLDSQGNTADADTKFKEFEDTLTDEQKAKDKEVQDAETAANDALTEDQKKALEEVDRLDSAAGKPAGQ